MEEKIRWKPRPVRIIVYLAVFAAVVALYSILRNYFLWLAAVMMAMLPIASITAAFYLCRHVEASLGVGLERQVKGGDVFLKLGLYNPTWCAALHSRIELSLSNTFLENTSHLKVSMPVNIHGESTLRLSVTVMELGRFLLQGDMLLVQDLMGFLWLCKPISLSGEVYVLPDGNREKLPDITGFLAGTAEMEEGRGKGSDFSEVSGVREYLPGDRQRDIHWKLSAGQDTLMVKERVAVSGNEMAIVPGLVQRPEQSMALLEETFRFALSCVALRTPVCIFCWNGAEYRFEEYRSISLEELKQNYCEIYRTTLTNSVTTDWDTLMRNCYPFLQSYLFLNVREDTGKVQVEMHENA
ncbi:MAG: DUF58 domain-containing protein [Muribaculaceae bacterium]|nr:DUF58 domain-containing protein [Muribaculaceae bacterium]